MTRSDAVSSTIVHFSGSVVASCSGQRHFETQKSSSSDSNDSDDDTDYGFNQVKSSTYDNSLKLWAK